MQDLELKLDGGARADETARLRAVSALKRVDGVESVEIAPEGDRAKIRHDAAKAPTQRLVAALARAGIQAQPTDPAEMERRQKLLAAPGAGKRGRRTVPFGGRRLEIRVRGMHCASCVGTVEEALKRTPGVLAASVNLADERAQVSYDTGKVDREEIYRRVRLAGYEPLAPAPEAEEAAEDERRARSELRSVLAAAIPGVILMALMLAPERVMHHPAVQWGSFLLATLVQVGPGRAFYAGAFRALRARRPNMDVLVALGTTAAYGLSVAAFLGAPGLHGQIYFETSVLLVAFIRLGKWLEVRARGRASRALRELLALEPATAGRLVAPGPDGSDGKPGSPAGEAGRGGHERVERVPLRDVKVGDVLEVLPGEKVPVDGEVVSGRSAVDEAMITGEAAPAPKSPGDRVIGATINRSGTFRMRAQHVGDDTTLAQIVRMVRAAQADRAPIQRLADAVAAVFVPAVLVLAAATFAFWALHGAGRFGAPPGLSAAAFALTLAISVVVIACPCALGLATPTAILVGSGIGLRRGVLLKKASALEALARLRLVLLDKTGTLTRGRFEPTDVVVADGVSKDEMLALAVALESRSTHPLAQGVVAAAGTRGDRRPVEDLEEHGGRGVSGIVGGERIRAGARALLEEAFVDIPPALAKRAEALAGQGKSIVFVARGTDAVGLVALADALRPEAPDVVRALRERGIEVALVTGDNALAARAVAAAAGIERVYAEVPPDGKGKIVAAARAGMAATRGTVAFVGDGINDAPALAAADVGIAIGGGTDVAKETGDVVLVRNDLRDLLKAIALGEATLRKVRQNLFLAFFYNVAAIPVAAGALWPAYGLLLKPEVAGLAMALSSVSVVLNALTLKRIERRL